MKVKQNNSIKKGRKINILRPNMLYKNIAFFFHIFLLLNSPILSLKGFKIHIFIKNIFTPSSPARPQRYHRDLLRPRDLRRVLEVPGPRPDQLHPVLVRDLKGPAGQVRGAVGLDPYRERGVAQAVSP